MSAVRRAFTWRHCERGCTRIKQENNMLVGYLEITRVQLWQTHDCRSHVIYYWFRKQIMFKTDCSLFQKKDPVWNTYTEQSCRYSVTWLAGARIATSWRVIACNPVSLKQKCLFVVDQGLVRTNTCSLNNKSVCKLFIKTFCLYKCTHR